MKRGSGFLTITKHINQLRFYTLVSVVWFMFLFNIERLDIDGKPVIDLTNVTYFTAVFIGLAALAFPNLGQLNLIYMWAAIFLAQLGVYFLLGKEVVETHRTVIDGVVILTTLIVTRGLVDNLLNTENTFQDYVLTDESHILSYDEAHRLANEEIRNLKVLNKNMAVIYARVYSDDTYLASLATTEDVLDKHLDETFLARRLQVQLGRFVMGITYTTDIVFEYGYGIAVCLLESNREETQKFLQQLDAFVRKNDRFTLWTGIGIFPEDGKDIEELLTHARDNMEIFVPTTDIPEDVPRIGDVSVTISDRLRIEAKSEWVNKLAYQSSTARAIYRPIKRLMDIVGASVALLLLSPVYIAVGLAIYLDDGWPIFFLQDRVGLGGKTFRMYKFRSMYKDAPPLEPKVVHLSNGKIRLEWPEKDEDDPRITKVGLFIRKTSIDELPQIWNVLIGDMSLIGPRPSSWGLDQHTLHQTARLTVKPGITGLWQVSARDSKNFDERLLWDLKYVEKMGLWLDIQILLRTAGAVLRRSGS
jgi:lipopolysaccharide/colanic/teichoic acid biosynthesis glycosyltransferase